jgi:hypothetical protein
VKDLAALAMVWFGFWCLNKRRSLFIANEKLSECYYFELFIPNLKIRSFYNWDRCNWSVCICPHFLIPLKLMQAIWLWLLRGRLKNWKATRWAHPPLVFLWCSNSG